MRLTDKVAIITGGSRGLGRAIALAFAGEGAKIAVVGRNKSRCDEVISQISKRGGEAISIMADVASDTDVTRMVEQTKDKFKRIDILVNNAAVNLPYRTVSDLSLDEWTWVLRVNLTGSFLCAKTVLPEMIAQQTGKIINISSVGGRRGAAGRSPYRATKAALINFTECLAAEVKKYGIDVNAICPGAMDTDMAHEIDEKASEYAMPPDDVARVALFLASDDSRSITGTAIDAYGRNNPIFGVLLEVSRPR
jgi:3-oxoacyl-[acyl-carrier protein] reductase